MATLRDGLVKGDDGVVRCWWGCTPSHYAAYHDDEWGVPVDDDTRLFEQLSLEGFQAGLSWLTILNKRDNFRRAFAGFDPARVARFGRRDVERLLGDAGIVRHRGKIETTIANARAALDVIDDCGSLAALLWRHEPAVAERPRRFDKAALLAVGTPASAKALSKELKRRGFGFVGPTTVYAFMQAAGLVNDHLEGCPQRKRVAAARAAFDPPRG